jgi:hypothetical protein
MRKVVKGTSVSIMNHPLHVMFFLLLIILFLSPPTSSSPLPPPSSFTPSPQYVLVNKALGATDPLAWSPVNPDSITQASFDNIINTVGTKGSASRRLGISVQIPLFYTPTSGSTAFLQKLLSMCEANDMPVAFALDPFEFWEGIISLKLQPRSCNYRAGRPDLWNWFDPNSPGYNSSNVHNVEWTSWDRFNAISLISPLQNFEVANFLRTICSSSATQIAWRDWGRQFRVAPQPNLASKSVTDAHSTALFSFSQIVAEWYNKLPEEKQYLLAAAKVGWEVDIGLNFYFYPNGNSYRTQPPANDPTDFSKIVQQVRLLNRHVTRHASHVTRHTSCVTSLIRATTPCVPSVSNAVAASQRAI